MKFLVTSALALGLYLPVAVWADGHHDGDIAVWAEGGKIKTGGDHFELHADGKQIFEANFGDFFGGLYRTQSPGFQTQHGRLLPGDSLLSFVPLGKLSFWDGQSWTQSLAATQSVSVTDVWGAVSHWRSSGVELGDTQYVDQVASDGGLHSHLDMRVTNGAKAGVYLIQLQLASEGLADSQPFYLAFNRGLNDAAFESAVGSLTSPVPEPSSYLMLVIGLAGLGFVAKRRSPV